MSNFHEKKQIGRPKTLNRQSVIEKSMHTYWEAGIRHTSLNDVCRVNDISKPSFYREFGGEDGLIDSVVDHYSQIWLAPIEDILRKARPFKDGLNAYLSYVTNPAQFPHGCLVVNMLDDIDRLGPQSQQRLTSLQAKNRQLYRDWVQRGQRNHELRSDIEISELVYFIEVQFLTVSRHVAKKDSPSLICRQAQIAFESLFLK